MIYDLGGDYFVRQLTTGDLDGPYLSWFDDQDVCRYNSHGKFFKGRQEFERYLENSGEPHSVVWAICHRVDGHIGNIGLDGISLIHRHADFVVLIGDKRHWGRGAAYLAAHQLFEHGFSKLNLGRIWCAAAAPNVGMLRLAAKLGMSEEGRRRNHLYLDGGWVDMVEFGILRQEFRSAGLK